MNRISKILTGATGAALSVLATATPAQAQWYDGHRYRGGSHAAVNACVHHADRATRGHVRVTDVDRRGDNRFRVRGIIERGFEYRGRHHRRASFTCTARRSGRVTNFDIDRRGW
ncbi:MAG TPA: hypothetical protein VJR87_03600 [Allosphingosinicella sp.]|nr:hypothetical protein [Allosphingosinicella sp.]